MNRKAFLFYLLIVVISFTQCDSSASNTSYQKYTQQNLQERRAVLSEDERETLSEATFAGGCFWCTEAVFERVKGVKEVVSGYSGGEKENPTYEEVGSGRTKHAEAVQIYYDPSVISYEELLEIFFATHDPTQLNRQGPDVGKQYRSVVFYRNDEEKVQVENYIKKLNDSGKYDKEIVTEVTAFTAFYKAEDYHQDYYELHPESGYIANVTHPKVVKFVKNFPDKLKPEYQKVSK